MKLLHLSDLHIGKQETTDLNEEEEAKRLVEAIVEKWKNDPDKPIIIVTGDIVDDGAEEQFITAREILKPLRDNGFQPVYIPGNHDYGWNGAHATAKKFILFKKYLYGVDCRITYPDVPISNDEITVIALNSMKAETGFWDGLLADGELGNKQLDELSDIIKSIREEKGTRHIIAVALHHHPFLFPDDTFFEKIGEWFGHDLKDGDDLMKIISGRVNVLLFGHEHRHIDFSKEFPKANLTKKYRIPVILSNGKSTEKKHQSRLITIDKTAGIKVEELKL